MPRLSALLSLILLAGGISACDVPQQTHTTQNQTTTTTTRQEPSRTDSVSGLAWVDRASLPREGERVLGLIGQGGPFRYSQDGAVFGNRERILPRQPRGYYREYTVPTPGEQDRGARRIVCGGQPVTRIAECYYTADHYATFRRIRP